MSDDKFMPKGKDEMRTDVIKDYNLDVEKQGDVIEKITEDKLSQQETLSVAINQKKDWRTKANDFEKGKNFYKKNPPKSQPAPQPKVVGETNQEYEDRLKKLEIATAGDKSETVLKAIEEHKKVYPDKSYKEISEMPFIKSIEEAETEQKKLDNASISPDGKQTEQPNQSFKGMTIKEFNDKYNPEGGEMTDAISDLYEKLKKDNA